MRTSTAAATMAPSRRLRPRRIVTTIPDMVSRKNIDALTALGERRRELRAELEVVEESINKSLKKVYPEGWTWDEITEASSLSLYTLRLRLNKLGLINSDKASPRPRTKEVAQERKSQARKNRIEKG